MATETVCKHEADIARLMSDVNHQESQDKRIESNLQSLVAAVQANQTTNRDNFEKLDKNFIKIESILREQSTLLSNGKEEQKNLKSSIGNLSDKVDSIESDVSSMNKEIESVKTTTEQHTERIDKIEKWIVKIVAFAAALITILQGINNFEGIRNLFIVEETKQVETEQKAYQRSEKSSKPTKPERK